ncbi:hypothetical protein [Stakelama tenebrarum]|uniref:Uncharacterized protein n=1 Tax=Stakelama tenebrarum TaxID=2711215 RepID=A0A6G6Y8Y1_9SPHN|nr:hypothetical protein [Sphingosinithalassobacter tenebrarum]QIG81370.1 hypothetical protein G5C33_17315 [Sphingosinithalassobacter tenebrarum]
MTGIAHVAATGDVLATAAVLLVLRYLLLFVPGLPRWMTRWTGRFAALFAILPALRMVVVSQTGQAQGDPAMLGAGLAIFAIIAALAVADAPLVRLLHRIRSYATRQR